MFDIFDMFNACINFQVTHDLPDFLGQPSYLLTDSCCHTTKKDTTLYRSVTNSRVTLLVLSITPPAWKHLWNRQPENLSLSVRPTSPPKYTILPEWTPPYVTLTQILMWRRLFYQQLHLRGNINGIVHRKIFSRQFISHPIHNRNGLLVQHLWLHVLCVTGPPGVGSWFFMTRVT